MRRIVSKQQNVAFIFCASPVIIDKRAEWGADPSNLQTAPDGAFLKMSSPTAVSHLVQPNTDKTAPIGWILGDGPGLFSKAPIWVDEEVLQPGSTKSMTTRDGNLNYDVTAPSMVCYNGDENGPDLTDGWVQKLTDLAKNYEL
jgi:hypothetical protein